MNSRLVSLTSQWFLAKGAEDEGIAVLQKLAAEVQSREAGTLVYLVHQGRPDGGKLASLPPAPPRQVTFFEVYRDQEAFLAHVGGETFTNFLKSSGHLFEQSSGSPFLTVSFLDRIAGFVRMEANEGGVTAETHPAPGVMVELLAKDQEGLKKFYESVFDWQYRTGGSGFAYVEFPSDLQPRLAGVGQAIPDDPIMSAGNHFYLQVDDLELSLQKIKSAGGSVVGEPMCVDGYRFAMFKDPEENVIGLISPFANSSTTTE